jgi:hypothetical protein
MPARGRLLVRHGDRDGVRAEDGSGVAGERDGLRGPQGSTGPTDPTGPQGLPGQTGWTGPTGPAGANGLSLLSGPTNPNVSMPNGAQPGDFYLDMVTEALNGPYQPIQAARPGESASGW